MILKKLRVYSKINNEIIREVKFNPSGLSVIMDYSSNQKETGSNIGKTTAVKIIDLCLNAKSASSIYKDSDTGSNLEVENYIINNKVSADLITVKDGKEYVLSRDLFPRGKRYINDEVFTASEYSVKLREILFDYHSEEKLPSFNQLISKYVRLDTNTEENLLRFSGPHVNNFVYNRIYQFLFGISRSDSEILHKQDNLKNNEQDISALLRKNQVKTVEELKVKISLLQEEIENQKDRVNESKGTIEFGKKEEYLLSLLENIKNCENKLSILIFKKKTYLDQIKIENTNFNYITSKDLEALYIETKEILGEKIVEFDEYVNFHNKMIEKRIETFSKLLEDIEKNILETRSIVEEYRIEYEKEKITFDFFINDDLEKHFTEYYNNKEVLKSYQIDKDYIEQKISEMDDINKYLDTIEIDKDKKKSIVQYYNDRFKYYTKSIIGESLNIVFVDNHDNFPISITSAYGKPGTGMKKALMTCFDLAMIDLQIYFNIAGPKFQIHDKLENISINELREIINISRTFQGQYIFPVLKDRVDTLNIKENEIILKLSSEDKFFKI